MNIWEVRWIVLGVGLCAIQNGYCLAGTNLLSPILYSKYKESRMIWLVDAAGVLGMAIGSISSGSLMSLGR